MGENSAISWTDHTFNPWIGCSKVSPGCKNCYAEALMDKRYGRVQWGDTGTRKRTSEAYWKAPLKCNAIAKQCVRPVKVFAGSLCDVFEAHKLVLDQWRIDFFKLIEETPNLTWLLLTKRPDMINLLAPYPWCRDGWPDNVWMGTSIENDTWRDIRLAHLQRVPAKVKFVSVEPLIGPVNFTEKDAERVDWVIVGGESGPNRRKMNKEWVIDIKNWCVKNDVPFFFKQASLMKPGESLHVPGRFNGDDWKEFPKVVFK